MSNWFAVLIFVAWGCLVSGSAAPGWGEEIDDPLAAILEPELKPAIQVLLDTYRTQRRYSDEDFPLGPERYGQFRTEIVSRLAATLRLEDWVVRDPQGKKSRLGFRDRVLAEIEHHGVRMEIHAVEFAETGLVVPMVVCLPPGVQRCPAVCVFSGHSRNGLRDLVLDLESYQRGAAVRLARAGFVAIAVEKIDTGYLSRDGRSGIDEAELATTWLHWGRVTRSHQLMACLAASEILAVHPRVDETRIGATGVSLGGWLSVQTALLSDRIAAVADFGRKTMSVSPNVSAAEYPGQLDLCHILPGMLSLCDRNLLSLAYCPRPMLAGHGRKDTGSHREGPVHYQQLYQSQYEKLGAADRFAYHIHDGGDTMPTEVVIEYFARVLRR